NDEWNATDPLEARKEKLAQLYETSVEPFDERFMRTYHAQGVIDAFDDFDKEELAEKEAPITIAGRIMTKRGKGKAGFSHIQDLTGQIQIYVRKDQVGEDQYAIFQQSDIGDIVGVTGVAFKT